MEAEGGQPEAAGPLALHVLETIKLSQAQHGLRHGDHRRYWQYCARKLRTLYKATRFTHGKGKYLRRELTAANATSLGHLLILLYSAERCWADAMTRKGASLERVRTTEPQRAQHVKRRLVKAAQWGAELARAARARCGEEAAVEAAAYSAWLSGLATQDRPGREAAALHHFSRACKLTKALVGTGPPELRALYERFVTEVEPAERYARYQAEQAQGGAGPAGSPADEAAEDRLLRKLQERAKTLRQTEAGEGGAAAPVGVTTVTWQGMTHPIPSERVRGSLARAAACQQEVERLEAGQAGPPELTPVYDRMLAAYGEAKGSVQQTLNSLGADRKEAAEDLRGLADAVTGLQLEAAVRRGQLLAAVLQSKLGRDPAAVAPLRGSKRGGGKGKKGQKLVRAEDVVKAWAGVLGALRALGEAAQRLGGRQGELLLEHTAAQAAHSRAWHCLYAGHAYLAADKPREAHALYARARRRAEEAQDTWEETVGQHAERVRELEGIIQQSQAWEVAAHAAALAGDSSGAAQATDKMAALGLEQATGAETYLLDGLDTWQSYAGTEPGGVPRMYPIPPRLQELTVKPIVLDAIPEHLAPPALEHRVAKKAAARGGFSSLFGWGGAKA